MSAWVYMFFCCFCICITLGFVTGHAIGARSARPPICVPGQKLHIPEVGDCYVFTPGNYYPNGEQSK